MGGRFGWPHVLLAKQPGWGASVTRAGVPYTHEQMTLARSFASSSPPPAGRVPAPPAAAAAPRAAHQRRRPGRPPPRRQQRDERLLRRAVRVPAVRAGRARRSEVGLVVLRGR